MRTLQRVQRQASTGGHSHHGPTHTQQVTAPNLVSTDGVLALQRSAGNAATTLAIQRDVATGTLEAPRFQGSAKLERCLQDRDRLRQGDPDTDATTRVQSALLELPSVTGNAYDLGPSGADGIYGQKTAGAIRKFKGDENLGSTQFGDVGPGTMGRLDDLFKGGGGVEPPVPVPPVPVPPTPVVDPKVEGILDQIMLQYQRLHVEQTRGVTQVERDLRSGIESKKDPILVQGLTFAAEKILDGLLGGGATSFRTLIKSGLDFLDDLPKGKELKDFGVDKPFDAAKKGAIDTVKGELGKNGEAEPLSAYMSVQHNALAEATLKNQEEFVIVAKPKLKEQPAEQAQKLLDEVKKQTEGAQERQYRTTVDHWAQANAQRTTGATASGADPAGTTFVDGLENKSVNSVPGVLELDINFDADNVATPVKVNKMTIAGLSDKVRQHLNDKNPTIRELGFPMRASGDSFQSFLETGSRISVAMAEDKKEMATISSHGTPISGTSSGGEQYIDKKGDGNGFQGIARIYADFDKQNVNAVGGIQGP